MFYVYVNGMLVGRVTRETWVSLLADSAEMTEAYPEESHSVWFEIVGKEKLATTKARFVLRASVWEGLIIFSEGDWIALGH